VNKLLPCAVALLLATAGRAAAHGEWDEPRGCLGIAVSEEGDALHMECMAENWSTPWASSSAGFAFFGSERTGFHSGVETRLRITVPAVVSAFVGAGVFAGRWKHTVDAAADGLDNDGDEWTDEPGEEAVLYEYLVAVYPEVGVRIWLGDALYLIGSARYFVTTDGRASDRLMLGAGVGLRF
jgi:hypothetical protein